MCPICRSSILFNLQRKWKYWKWIFFLLGDGHILIQCSPEPPSCCFSVAAAGRPWQTPRIFSQKLLTIMWFKCQANFLSACIHFLSVRNHLSSPSSSSDCRINSWISEQLFHTCILQRAHVLDHHLHLSRCEAVNPTRCAEQQNGLVLPWCASEMTACVIWRWFSFLF